MSLTTKMSRVPHIHIATAPVLQIALRFALQFAFSKVFVIFHFPIDNNPKVKPVT